MTAMPGRGGTNRLPSFLLGREKVHIASTSLGDLNTAQLNTAEAAAKFRLLSNGTHRVLGCHLSRPHSNDCEKRGTMASINLTSNLTSFEESSTICANHSCNVIVTLEQGSINFGPIPYWHHSNVWIGPHVMTCYVVLIVCYWGANVHG